MAHKDPPEPWKSLLNEVDAAATGEIALHCIGGFVLEIAYGLSRTTADLDFLCVAPPAQAEFLERFAGKGSPLARRIGAYLQHVTILSAYPDAYEDRLKALFPGSYRHLRLWALDPHDLALTKIERNWDLDRADLTLMAKAGLLDAVLLRQRYDREMRPYLVGASRLDKTVDLWAEIIDSVAPSERR
jgi:hypothetical protein